MTHKEFVPEIKQ